MRKRLTLHFESLYEVKCVERLYVLLVRPHSGRGSEQVSRRSKIELDGDHHLDSMDDSEC